MPSMAERSTALEWTLRLKYVGNEQRHGLPKVRMLVHDLVSLRGTAPDDRIQDVPLRPHILVHQRVGYASLLGDLANGHLVGIASREEILSGVDNRRRRLLA